jgi:hypothetical protein
MEDQFITSDSVIKLKKSQCIVDLKEIKIFRKAKPSDIVDGRTVYLIGDYQKMYVLKIAEVLKPNDDFKAFCDEDGCRYGLSDTYVLDEKMFKITSQISAE